ncbi:MAG: mechanosensitive ion channel family protein [Flavobacteriaceae bacterium]|nr:mechanosensitive ion channel family protein [Flavobacteriaceae bacterium]
MNLTEIKILETAISVILFFLLRLISIKLVERTVSSNVLQKTRGKIIKKIMLVGLITITLIFILTVWGVDQSELLMFMASFLTVMGIALFAQWSHLSNLTSGIIIFFNHSAKLDDTVTILDKDYAIEGRISDIGFFFIKLKTKIDEEVSIPNNIFLQKMVKKKIN